MSQKRVADIARAYSNGYNAAFNTLVVSIEEQKELFSAMELWRQENLPPEQLIEPDEED